MVEQTHGLGGGVSLYVLLSALVLSLVGLSAYLVSVINVKGTTNLIKGHSGFTAGCSPLFLYSC